MKLDLLVSGLILATLQTCVLTSLVDSLQGFFDVNAPLPSGTDVPSDSGFPPESGFPPDTGFPPDSEFPPSNSQSPSEPGFLPDTSTTISGSPVGNTQQGFPPEDKGFPKDPLPPVDPGTPLKANVIEPKPIVPDRSPSTKAGSAVTQNEVTKLADFPPIDVGMPISVNSPTDNTVVGPIITDPEQGGMPAQPFDPVDIFPPFKEGPLGEPLSPIALGPVTLPGQIPTGAENELLPISKPVDSLPTVVGTGQIPGKPSMGAENVFSNQPVDQPIGTGIGPSQPVDPQSLDFQFLPELPAGGNFVNLVSGSTDTFQPSLDWLGNPGSPTDISVNGPAPIDQSIGTDSMGLDQSGKPTPIDSGVKILGPSSAVNQVDPITKDQFIPVDTSAQFVDPNVIDPNPSGSPQDQWIGTGPIVVGPATTSQDKPKSGGVVTLFDLNEIPSASGTLGKAKPGENTLGKAEKVPNSWMQFYPSGRRPTRPVKADPTPVEVVEQVSAADRILADISLASYGRNRDLQKQLRLKRKQQRRQKRLERQRQKQQRQARNQGGRQQRGRRQNRGNQRNWRPNTRGGVNRPSDFAAGQINARYV